MTIDANENAEEQVSIPSNTSDEGIEAHLDAQSTDNSSLSSEENHEEKTNSFQKRINDVTAKKYQAERERDELREKLEKQQAAQNVQPVQAQEQLKAPSLPDDLYDEDAMKKYHGEMAVYSQEIAKQAASSVYESQQEKSAKQQQEAQHQKSIESYVNNAMRDGVDLEKLRGVENTLNQAGIKPELGQFIMKDVNGAKIAEYLADNPAEMHEVLSMDSVSAGIKIANEIKPKVLASTPKVSNAPDPIPDISGGGGFVEKDDFDKIYPGAEFI